MLDAWSHKMPLDPTENPKMKRNGRRKLSEVIIWTLFWTTYLVVNYNAGRHSEGWQLNATLTRAGYYRSNSIFLNFTTLNFIHELNDFPWSAEMMMVPILDLMTVVLIPDQLMMMSLVNHLVMKSLMNQLIMMSLLSQLTMTHWIQTNGAKEHE